MSNVKDLGRDTWTSVMDILALFQELDSPAGKEAVRVFMEKYFKLLAEVDREVATLNTKLAQIPISEAALKEANDCKDYKDSASVEENANIEDLQKKVQGLETALSNQVRETAKVTAASKAMVDALQKDVKKAASMAALVLEKVKKSKE